MPWNDPKLCEQCGATYTPKRSRQTFCSEQCYNLARRDQVRYPVTQRQQTKAGYVKIRVNGKLVWEHRHVMEQHLGRSLTKQESVHHINKCKSDNRLENLELCSSNAQHLTLHHTLFRDDTHKECSSCHEIKPRQEFGKSHKTSILADPHHTECLLCRAIRDKAEWSKGKTTFHRRRNGTTPNLKTCCQCQKEFNAIQSKSKFCSQECFADSLRRKPIICLHCKTEFVPTEYKQRFCSKKCGGHWRKYPN